MKLFSNSLALCGAEGDIEAGGAWGQPKQAGGAKRPWVESVRWHKVVTVGGTLPCSAPEAVSPLRVQFEDDGLSNFTKVCARNRKWMILLFCLTPIIQKHIPCFFMCNKGSLHTQCQPSLLFIRPTYCHPTHFYKIFPETRGTLGLLKMGSLLPESTWHPAGISVIGA